MSAPLPRWQIRALSAVVILPSVIVIVWKGGILFLVLITLAYALAMREWVRLARASPQPLLMTALGFFYIGCGFLTFYKIRAYFGGPEPAFLYMALIWLSDTGAYLIGKNVGGPKMTPRISPNKTWAGLAGATFLPAAALILAFLIVWEPALPLKKFGVIAFLILFSFLIGLSGQLGDLLLSWFKRWVRAKDTGTLIPGHGGILDRLDSMILSGMVYFFVMKWIYHHFDAAVS